MGEHVQQQRGDRQGGAGGGGDRDQAHVLHRRVGEHPFDVGVTVSIEAATSSVANPITSIPTQEGRAGGRVDDRLNRIITENATDSSTPLINALTGAGAWLCASASQV